MTMTEVDTLNRSIVVGELLFVPAFIVWIMHGLPSHEWTIRQIVAHTDAFLSHLGWMGWVGLALGLLGSMFIGLLIQIGTQEIVWRLNERRGKKNTSD